MAEKKEIFDYLRNRQKAAEIEAKVNGINLWVLAGAISIIAWQLLGSLEQTFWSQPEAILRTLLCTEGLYILSSWGSVHRRQQEVRYSQTKLADIESPFLVLLHGTSLLLPPLLSLIYVGKTLGSIILGLFGLVIVITSIMAIGSRLFYLRAKTEKFPKPDFEPTTRGEMIFVILSGVAFSMAVLEQIKFGWEHRGIMSVTFAKQLALLAALYLLALLIVIRKLRSNRIAWTYELETELLLGSITAEVAARRIEHRALGPRLQDVMDRFFDDLDCRVKILGSLFDQCRSKLELVKDVPLEYEAERTARIKGATEDLSGHIDALSIDCCEFSKYLKKLKEKNIGPQKAILAPHLTNLKSRHDKYAERLSNAKVDLEKLIADASTL